MSQLLEMQLINWLCVISETDEISRVINEEENMKEEREREEKRKKNV